MKDKKQTGKVMSKITHLIILFVFIFSIFLMVQTTNSFMTGFHNTDVCVNTKMISLKYDLNLYEKTLDGTAWDLNECYRKGVSQMLHSFYYMMYASILFGVSLLAMVLRGVKE